MNTCNPQPLRNYYTYSTEDLDERAVWKTFHRFLAIMILKNQRKLLEPIISRHRQGLPQRRQPDPP